MCGTYTQDNFPFLFKGYLINDFKRRNERCLLKAAFVVVKITHVFAMPKEFGIRVMGS